MRARGWAWPELVGVRITLLLAGLIILGSALPVYLALRHTRDLPE